MMTFCDINKGNESTMTQEQIDLVHELVREKVTLKYIAQMMGVDEGTKEYQDLRIVFVEAGFQQTREFNAKGRHRHESFQTEVDAD